MSTVVPGTEVLNGKGSDNRGHTRGKLGGMIVLTSNASQAETLRRLTRGIERRGITIFAVIDHAGAARDAGLELDDETVVIFGNPRAGTPLMQADARVGIELPLRILLWSRDGGVRVGYRDPRELADGYDLGAHTAALEQMAGLMEQLAAEASGSPAA